MSHEERLQYSTLSHVVIDEKKDFTTKEVKSTNAQGRGKGISSSSSRGRERVRRGFFQGWGRGRGGSNGGGAKKYK